MELTPAEKEAFQQVSAFRFLDVFDTFGSCYLVSDKWKTQKGEKIL
jgi:hypothetical protein